MYYIAEMLPSTQVKFVGKQQTLKEASLWAHEHSYRTGLMVEVQTEQGKTLERIFVWRE